MIQFETLHTKHVNLDYLDCVLFSQLLTRCTLLFFRCVHNSKVYQYKPYCLIHEQCCICSTRTSAKSNVWCMNMCTVTPVQTVVIWCDVTHLSKKVARSLRSSTLCLTPAHRWQFISWPLVMNTPVPKQHTTQRHMTTTTGTGEHQCMQNISAGE